jgi:hypothetical protein
MIRTRVAMITMLVLASPLASCGRGDGPALYPVHGKVIFNGQPAEGATVMFQREDAPATGAASFVPTGMVDKEGNFSLETEDVGYGAPAGKYKVLIQWRIKGAEIAEPQTKPKKGRRSNVVTDKPDGVPDRLKGRYMKSETAQIKVEVKPEENTFQAFDVSS